MKNHQIESKNTIRKAKLQHGRQRQKAKPQRAAKSIRIKLLWDFEFVALIDRGAKACRLSRSGFIRQAIVDVLP